MFLWENGAWKAAWTSLNLYNTVVVQSTRWEGLLLFTPVFLLVNGSGVGAGESTLESRTIEESLEGNAGGKSVGRRERRALDTHKKTVRTGF